MNPGEFQVDRVFDVVSRGGILVVGTFAAERPVGVPAMRDAATGQLLTILGMDFPTARTLATGQTTFVLDRADRDCASPGRIWTDAAEDSRTSDRDRSGQHLSHRGVTSL
ncbi:hypothetical protein AB0H43_13915 [Hamadaea sp. NPDC050747]|uniref:hypothetical protein n=1 Tax=Hamadaea sp. NPDC050747 TaxID=3155789 RepID=UPI0033F6C9F5